MYYHLISNTLECKAYNTTIMELCTPKEIYRPSIFCYNIIMVKFSDYILSVLSCVAFSKNTKKYVIGEFYHNVVMYSKNIDLVYFTILYLIYVIFIFFIYRLSLFILLSFLFKLLVVMLIWSLQLKKVNLNFQESLLFIFIVFI